MENDRQERDERTSSCMASRHLMRTSQVNKGQEEEKRPEMQEAGGRFFQAAGQGSKVQGRSWGPGVGWVESSVQPALLLSPLFFLCLCFVSLSPVSGNT